MNELNDAWNLRWLALHRSLAANPLRQPGAPASRTAAMVPVSWLGRALSLSEPAGEAELSV